MKILKTKSYYFGVAVNSDGTLNITAEYKHIGNGQWRSCHSEPWSNTAALIGSYGSAEALLEQCEEIDDLATVIVNRNAFNAADRKRQAAAEATIEERLKQTVNRRYAEVFGDGSTVVDSTLENIAVLLRYLNTHNWGGWQLPPMTIGYQCNQYDCNGRVATTIILDKPVYGYTRLQFGAPRGHLGAYTAIDKALRGDNVQPPLVSLGDQIKAARKVRGLTQEEVAAAIGMKRETYNRIECGGGTTVATLEKIGEYFGLRLTFTGKKD